MVYNADSIASESMLSVDFRHYLKPLSGIILVLSLTGQTQAAINVHNWQRPPDAANAASLTTWGPVSGGLQAAVGTADSLPARDATYHVVLRNTTGRPIDICPLPETQLFALTSAGQQLPAHGISFGVFQPATDTLEISSGDTYTHWLGLTLQQSYDRLPTSATALIAKVVVKKARDLSQCTNAPTINLVTLPVPI